MVGSLSVSVGDRRQGRDPDLGSPRPSPGGSPPDPRGAPRGTPRGPPGRGVWEGVREGGPGGVPGGLPEGSLGLLLGFRPPYQRLIKVQVDPQN